MSSAPTDLRQFLATLESEGLLCRVSAEVDADLELAEIHRRVIAANGPALLFENIRGRAYPVVTNLFGTQKRVELAFGKRPGELVERAAALPEELMPPTLGKLWQQRDLFKSLARVGLKRVRRGSVTEVVERAPRLTELPALRTWKRDGGPFVTLPLVYTEHPETHTSNLGMYRIQIFNETQTGLHMQIGKGGGFHLAEAERLNQPLPVNIHVGGPPAAILSAIAPLPENVPELLLGSLMLGRKLRLSDNPAGPLPLLADAEFAIVGQVEPGARHPEGPFGDHYGYYSEIHDYPRFDCKALLHRKDAIFPATIVGKPRQEDFFIGDYLQELLGPLLPRVMPGVRDLWSYGETGYHSLSAAIVHERYARESMSHAFRILGEGQLSLTKFLLLTDSAVDLHDFKSVLTHILERADFRTDLFLFPNLSMDSLDYAGPTVNHGSKGVLVGTGEPIRKLPTEFHGDPRQPVRKVRVFAPGCLVIEGPSFDSDRDCRIAITSDPAFTNWPLLVLTDDADRAAKSSINFLWTTFTRFDPAADICSSSVELTHNHPAHRAPILIDARMKPDYPEELFCDEETAKTVSERWKQYFPAGVEMGDSDQGHLD
ncbi:MAG: UbiD family decarboxylase [Planctomycetota bacterium]|jgi:UbiD family decarboxylase